MSSAAIRAPSTEAPIKVLFIGGYGRSGSTLLDRVLGSVEGFWSVGELRHVFREGYVENRLCGCGEPFRECPFWRRVTLEAFGPIEAFDAPGVLEVQGRVDRWWRLPRLLRDSGRDERVRQLRWYRDRLRDLYRAIASVSGARVIVDSSKDVSHGYVLRGVGLPVDPYVLHLVRDSRAVAHSWQRHKHNPGSGGEMQRYGLVRASAEWTAINALTGMHRSTGARYRTLRYRDFVADPAAAVRAALDFVGEPQARLPLTRRNVIKLGIHHTAAGNPNRFRRGELQVRSDDEWQTRMPAASRALVTALTMPALLRYGGWKPARR